MIIERSYIVLRNVRFHAFHGVMPQERQVGGDFEVSLKAEVDLTHPMASDDVADTVSYADIYETLKQEMEKPSKLLEHVAGRIGQVLFDNYQQISAIDLQIIKLNPPMGADSTGAGIELHLTR